MKRIGVLVSGGGSNLQALIDAVESGFIRASIGVVISNKVGAYALERAAKHQIAVEIIDHRHYSSNREFSQAIVDSLHQHAIDIVCLAGFMRIIDPVLISAYPNRILNIHPALLPSFGGKGMYGHYVHEAVIAAGVKYSGATVHLVTPETDVGPILAQGVVPVNDDDTPETIAAKVLKIEHEIYPKAVKLLVEEQLEINGLRVKTKPSVW